jgi:hypothetical protein
MENPKVNEDSGIKVDPIGDSSSPARQPSVDERLQKVLDRALYAGGQPAAQKIRNFLNGTWLGEPLHVVLKDVPTGAWTVAMVFDLLDIALARIIREGIVSAQSLVQGGLQVSIVGVGRGKGAKESKSSKIVMLKLPDGETGAP